MSKNSTSGYGAKRRAHDPDYERAPLKKKTRFFCQKLMSKNSASGYGAKRRAHDPDYEHVENAKYREYERLEAEGYDDEIKDPETNRPVIKKVRERGRGGGIAAVAKWPKVRPHNSKDPD
jgi:hypothetical protein